MNELLLSILQATARHTGYTLVCVAIGFTLGLFLGICLSRLMEAWLYGARLNTWSSRENLVPVWLVTI